ncbi:MAG: hypothetical protein WC011_00095 [Candidatus Paceibacterota bacterium]
MINKDEKLKTSPPYLGYLILKKISKTEEKKVMLDDIFLKLKAEIGSLNYRQFMFTLIFLYQSGIIDFAEPYIYKR